jgi:1-acyl-sn-glycerol-3-phosphate acyltransferase
VLEKGGLLCAFPEARLPKDGDVLPLPFKPSTAYIALKSGAPLIPVYTVGNYISAKRNYVIIGEPIYVDDYATDNLSEKELVEKINDVMRNKIIELKDELTTRLNKKTNK